MNVLQKAWAGIKWFTPVQRWTALVTIVALLAAGGYIIAAVLGITDIRTSPTAIVHRFYQAAQDGQVDQFRKLLNKEGRDQIDAMSSTQVDELLNTLSYDHTTTDLWDLGVRNFGDHAVVGLQQSYGSDGTHLRVEVLDKEGAAWKVEWPPGVKNWSESIQRFDPFYHGPAAPTPTGPPPSAS